MKKRQRKKNLKKLALDQSKETIIEAHYAFLRELNRQMAIPKDIMEEMEQHMNARLDYMRMTLRR